MTALRQRLIDDLHLRGYAERTVETYVAIVARLARHFRAAPDQLTEAQLRAYFLHLTRERKLARSSFTQTLCGLRFFYEQTLGRRWTILDVVRPQRARSLPVVLSRDEVWRALAAVRLPAYRACLTTIYGCGLRLREALDLHVDQVDSGRMLLHIRRGKGGVDRLVPVPDALLGLLRAHWRTHRNPVWMFPAPRRHPARPVADPASARSIRRCCIAHSRGRCGRAGSPNGRTCIRSATATPRISWKRACRSHSFRRTWAIAVPAPPPSTRT